MIFVKGLPRVHDKSVFLSVVDRFSKMARFIPLGHPYSAATVVHAFFTDIIQLHGLPETIVSDRDPVFTNYKSVLVRTLLPLQGSAPHELCLPSAV